MVCCLHELKIHQQSCSVLGDTSPLLYSVVICIGRRTWCVSARQLGWWINQDWWILLSPEWVWCVRCSTSSYVGALLKRKQMPAVNSVESWNNKILRSIKQDLLKHVIQSLLIKMAKFFMLLIKSGRTMLWIRKNKNSWYLTYSQFLVHMRY